MTIDVTVPYVRSPYVVFQPHGDEYVAYHTLYGFPSVVNEASRQILMLFDTPTSIATINEEYEIDDLDYCIADFVRRHFLIRPETDERAEIAAVVDQQVERITSGEFLTSLGLIVHEACNFGCGYCISKKLISATKRNADQKPQKMSWSSAQNAIDSFMTFCLRKGKKEAEVYFGGSEPMLNWGVIRRAIEYCVATYGDRLSFSFSMNSNASLITPGKARFLTKHTVTVTTSLDGPSAVNDSVRVFLSGRGTFDAILKGWDNLGDQGRPITWFCLTLTDENIDRIDESFFDFLVKRGITSCSIEPDIIVPMKHSPEAIVASLIQFKQWGNARGITVGGLWDKPVKNLYETEIEKKLFNCSAFTGRGISVLPSGAILPCSYSGKVLGSIDELERFFSSASFAAFVRSRAIGNIEACKGCEIEGQCMGGCYITPEYAERLETDAGFNYRCAVYKIATRSLVALTMDFDEEST